jgi:DNA-directed RNA polymerase subunit L
LPVWAFKPVHGDLETDNEHIIYDMVMRRFATIPIDQRDGEPIEFYAHNPSPLIVDVKSEIKDPKTSKLVCNPNLTMFTLVPNTFLKIRLPRVLDYGYSFAGHTLASCAYSRKVDVSAASTSVSTSAITNWEVGFTTNGNMEPHKIIDMACDEIIRRVKAVATARRDVGIGHVITVPGESHTVGFLMQQFLNAISGVTATYQVSNVAREVTITVHSSDVEKCVADVIKQIVEIFESIKMLISI